MSHEPAAVSKRGGEAAGLELPAEYLIEGVARAFERSIEARPDLADRLLDRMAELRCELMTADEAAEMLGVEKKTLRERWKDYGLDKSTALGPNEPRYFRSQVVAAAKREGVLLHGITPRVAEVRGSLAKKISPFPKRTAPTLPASNSGAA